METQNKYAVATRNGNQETGVATRQEFTPAMIEKVLIRGDLKELSLPERVQYYMSVCQACGVDPFLKPFDLITLDGKLTMYANKNCAEQLRNKHGLSLRPPKKELFEDVYIVEIEGYFKGRVESAIGAVPFVKENGEWENYTYKGEQKRRFVRDKDNPYSPLTPQERANAMMKAETKAKRRVTFGMVGLSIFTSRDDDIDAIEGTGIEIIDTAKEFDAQLEQALLTLPEAQPEEPEPLDLKGQKAKDILFPGDTPEGPSQKTKDDYQKIVKVAIDMGIEYVALSDLTDEASLLAAGKALATKIREAREA